MMEGFTDWQGAAGIGAAVSLLLPFVIYVDWRKHGRTMTSAAYWNNWLGMSTGLAVMLLILHAWQATGIAATLAGVGGLALGLAAGFWYVLLLEFCLRTLGAIVPAPQPAPSP